MDIERRERERRNFFVVAPLEAGMGHCRGVSRGIVDTRICIVEQRNVVTVDMRELGGSPLLAPFLPLLWYVIVASSLPLL